MNMKSMRVLIVDDLPQVRQGLKSLLQLASKKTTPVLEVVGEASDGRQALRQAQVLQPDVILMDLEMPGLDGFEATRQIKAAQPGVRVVILSIHAGAEEERARQAGADDFVVKGAGYHTLLNAILNRDAENQSFDRNGE